MFIDNVAGIYPPLTQCKVANSRMATIFRNIPKYLNNNICRNGSTTVKAVTESLKSKGFLRPHKSYTAPSNAAVKVQAICSALKIPNNEEHKLTNLEEKFKFLDACFTNFQHGVPNSQVHDIQTVGDVIKFYGETVDTTVPYDALKNQDLPENLHIQYDYMRFHPETDTKFSGKTAFPKSSTLVTGLKYRSKYPGHEAKRSWP